MPLSRCRNGGSGRWPALVTGLLRLVTTSSSRGLTELGAEPGKAAGRLGGHWRGDRVGGHQKAGRAEAETLPKQTAHNPTFLGIGCAPCPGQELHPPWPPSEGGWKEQDLSGAPLPNQAAGRVPNTGQTTWSARLLPAMPPDPPLLSPKVGCNIQHTEQS